MTWVMWPTWIGLGSNAAAGDIFAGMPRSREQALADHANRRRVRAQANDQGMRVLAPGSALDPETGVVGIFADCDLSTRAGCNRARDNLARCIDGLKIPKEMVTEARQLLKLSYDQLDPGSEREQTTAIKFQVVRSRREADEMLAESGATDGCR